MKHKTLRTLLCVILTVCFCLSAIVPASAAGLFGGDSGAATGWDQLIRGLKDRFIEKNPGTDETPATNETAAGNDFIRIFHLDCGRKYFTVKEIENIIDWIAENHYTHIELAFGNDGFRFLLDDMTVGTYNSDQVKTAIQNGNIKDHLAKSTGVLSEADMNGIIAYAESKGIGVIPLIDVPGHTNALVYAMQELKVNDLEFRDTNKNASGNTTLAFKAGDNDATRFVVALVEKYVDYFAAKKSVYFNIGADECGYQTVFVDETQLSNHLLLPLAEYIVGKNMTPMIFNDGFRTDNTLQNALKNNDYGKKIVVCYWTLESYTKAADIARDFKIINTHNKWYYVAGKEGTEWFGYKWATGNINETSADSTW